MAGRHYAWLLPSRPYQQQRARLSTLGLTPGDDQAVGVPHGLPDGPHDTCVWLGAPRGASPIFLKQTLPVTRAAIHTLQSVCHQWYGLLYRLHAHVRHSCMCVCRPSVEVRQLSDGALYTLLGVASSPSLSCLLARSRARAACPRPSCVRARSLAHAVCRAARLSGPLCWLAGSDGTVGSVWVCPGPPL